MQYLRLHLIPFADVKCGTINKTSAGINLMRIKQYTIQYTYFYFYKNVILDMYVIKSN